MVIFKVAANGWWSGLLMGGLVLFIYWEDVSVVSPTVHTLVFLSVHVYIVTIVTLCTHSFTHSLSPATT